MYLAKIEIFIHDYKSPMDEYPFTNEFTCAIQCIEICHDTYLVLKISVLKILNKINMSKPNHGKILLEISYMPLVKSGDYDRNELTMRVVKGNGTDHKFNLEKDDDRDSFYLILNDLSDIFICISS
jgi:hypothetical protein